MSLGNKNRWARIQAMPRILYHVWLTVLISVFLLFFPLFPSTPIYFKQHCVLKVQYFMFQFQFFGFVVFCNIFNIDDALGSLCNWSSFTICILLFWNTNQVLQLNNYILIHTYGWYVILCCRRQYLVAAMAKIVYK